MAAASDGTDGSHEGPADRRWVRLVLAVGIVAGVVNAALLVRLNPEQVGIATDVYRYAATRALAGTDLYLGAPPDHPGYHFLYPPVVVVAFLPYALLGGPTAAYALSIAANLLTVGALGAVMVRAVEMGGVDLPLRDRLLVVGYAGGSVGAASTVVQGQVNLQLALAIAGGVLLLERGREVAGGAAMAVAAAVKLFPALVGAWLLGRRAWRAMLAATGVGVGVLLAGLALFGPEPTATWLTVTLPREAAVGTFADGPDPHASLLTVRRQLSVLAPWLPAAWLLPAAAAVLAPVVLAAYRTFEGYRSRLVALQATVLATLTLFPLEPFYLALAVFPTVPLCYLLEPSDATTRRLFLAGTLVASVPITMTSVELVAGIVVPPALAPAVLDVAASAFAFVLPQTCGVWLLLAACVHYQHRGAGSLRGGSSEGR